jgi:nitroreductase/NAD-dependent dihydropyrimidine dehydrogenase PreA subunit
MMRINKQKCIGCGKCIDDCLVNDIIMIKGKAQIKNESCFKCGHCIAICPVDAVSTDEYKMGEVKEYNDEEFSIPADNLLNFIKFRRTIRQFKDQKVEKRKIRKIIEAGRFTPTSSNQQDVAFTVVKDEIDKFRGLILKNLNQKGNSIIDNLSPDTMKFKKYAEMWIDMYQDFQNGSKNNDRLFFEAPLVIVVSANSSVNGSLASSNMELMANALDLGVLFSGFTVRGAQNKKEVREFLNIKKNKEIVTALVIGYPDVEYFRTAPRKEADISWK